MLIALLLATVFVWAITTAFASQLHASDAAGNGLAQGFYVAALLLQWLLVAIAVLGSLWMPGSDLQFGPASRHVPTVLAIAGLAPILAHAISLPWLFDARHRGAPRTAVVVTTALPPLALLGFVAWRAQFVLLPDVFAAWGSLGTAIAAPLTTVAIVLLTRTTNAQRAPTIASLAHPVLLLRDGVAVRACHHTDDTRSQVATAPEPAALVVVDANCARWSIASSPDGEPTFVRHGEPLTFEQLRAAILRVPRLDADGTRDAEIRRLVTMQTNVTSLAFVLPH